MKLDPTSTVVETNLNATAIALQIDMSGMTHIMSLLSNMYSNPPLAVLREYAVNARDSHFEARNLVPIEITAPTPISPQLVITDHGIGMSRQDLEDTYSKYGASTKRQSNDQVGAFGIGAKSAFTIASQFTVVGVKDGRKIIALFSLNQDNTPVMQILSDTETTDRHGVQVTVPVEDVREMNKTIQGFFYAWRPGTVLVDGVEPTNLWTDKQVMHLSSTVHLAPPNPDKASWEQKTQLHVVMGGISYDSDQELPKIQRGSQIYVEVPIGSVDIAPSREALKDTDKTRATVKQAKVDFQAGLKATEQAAMLRVMTAPEKCKVAIKWGETKDTVEWAAHMKEWGLSSLTPEVLTAAGLDIGGLSTRGVQPWSLNRFWIVTGCDTARKQGLVEKRGERWAKEARDDYRGRIIISSASDSGSYEWFTFGVPGGIETVDYKTFKAEAAEIYKVDRPSSSGPAYHVKIGGKGEKQYRVPIETIQLAARSKKVVLLGSYESWLDFLDDTYIQVQLTNGRQSHSVAAKRLGGVLEDKELLRKQERDRQIAAVSPYDQECIAYAQIASGTLVNILDKMDDSLIKNLRLSLIKSKIKQGRRQSYELRKMSMPDAIRNTAETEFRWAKNTWILLNHMSLPYDWHNNPTLKKAIEDYLNA